MAEIQKVSYTHEAIILWLIEHPDRSLRECADTFGYTQPWLSTVIHSDAFQEQLRLRQNEMMVVTSQDIREKLRATTDVAIDGLARKLEKTEDGGFLLDVTDKLLARMGYGPASARNPAPAVTNNIQHITVTSNDLAEARSLMNRPQMKLVEAPVSDE